jgi:hypothetical protein
VNGTSNSGAATNYDSNADLGAQAWWMQLVANARDYDSRSLHTGEHMQLMFLALLFSIVDAQQLYTMHALLLMPAIYAPTQ